MSDEKRPHAAKATSRRQRTCTLIVTHRCNLDCVYCYESFKSPKAMPFDLAIGVLKSEFEMLAGSDDFDEIIIEFMGGEPTGSARTLRSRGKMGWVAPGLMIEYTSLLLRFPC
jgi:sulfatase maturation enzyme AslB (radical SAM superfamily)